MSKAPTAVMTSSWQILGSGGQVADLINKIHDETGGLDFQVNNQVSILWRHSHNSGLDSGLQGWTSR